MSFTLNEITFPSFNAQDIADLKSLSSIQSALVSLALNRQNCSLQTALTIILCDRDSFGPWSPRAEWCWYKLYLKKPLCNLRAWVTNNYVFLYHAINVLGHGQDIAVALLRIRQQTQTFWTDDRTKKSFQGFPWRSIKVLQGLCVRTQNILDFLLYFSILSQPRLIGKNTRLQNNITLHVLLHFQSEMSSQWC